MLYLSLTLGCFEMHPLSTAGKNKIPSFDSYLWASTGHISWQCHALIFKCCELTGVWKAVYFECVQYIKFRDQGEFNPATFPRPAGKRRSSEGELLLAARTALAAHVALNRGCPIQPSWRLDGSMAEIYPPAQGKAGWKPYTTSSWADWNQSRFIWALISERIIGQG